MSTEDKFQTLFLISSEIFSASMSVVKVSAFFTKFSSVVWRSQDSKKERSGRKERVRACLQIVAKGCPGVKKGNAEESTTLSPVTPITFALLSTTASASVVLPILLEAET